MKTVSDTTLQLSFAVFFVLALAFSGLAAQIDDKEREAGSSNRALAAEQRRGDVRPESDETRRRDDKALEQMDKARHRDEAEREEPLPRGSERNRERDRTEIDKGSEQGQKMREEHSRKWWKFWE